MDYKSYKVRVKVKRSSKVSLPHPSHSGHIFHGEMAGVCTKILQGPCSIFRLRNFRQKGAAEATKYTRCAFQRFLFTYVCLGQPLEKLVLSTFLTTKVCSVRFFKLQKLVVHFFTLQKFVVRFFRLQKLQCPLFETTRVCNVRFFGLQKLQCPLFETTRVCNVRVFRLQKLQCPHFQTTRVCNVCFFRLQKFVVHLSDIYL